MDAHVAAISEIAVSTWLTSVSETPTNTHDPAVPAAATASPITRSWLTMIPLVSAILLRVQSL